MRESQVRGQHLLAGQLRLPGEVKVEAVQHPDTFVEAQISHRPGREDHHHPVDGVDLAGSLFGALPPGEIPATAFAVVEWRRVPADLSVPPGDSTGPA